MLFPGRQGNEDCFFVSRGRIFLGHARRILGGPLETAQPWTIEMERTGP
jgi:hypothetical protein